MKNSKIYTVTAYRWGDRVMTYQTRQLKRRCEYLTGRRRRRPWEYGRFNIKAVLVRYSDKKPKNFRRVI